VPHPAPTATGTGATTATTVAAVGKAGIPLIAKIVAAVALTGGIGVAVRATIAPSRAPAETIMQREPALPAPREELAPRRTPVVAVQAPAPEPAAAIAAPPAPVAHPRVHVAPLPPAAPAPAVVAGPAQADDDATPPHAEPPKPSAPAPSLADEVTALDAARAALARGDSALALTDLDAYERRFPSGVLAPEADVVRIEALFAAGDVSAARGRAGRFLASHANSPLAARVRELVLRAR